MGDFFSNFVRYRNETFMLYQSKFFVVFRLFENLHLCFFIYLEAPPYEWGPGGEPDQPTSFAGASGAEERAYSTLTTDTDGSFDTNNSMPSRDGGVCSVRMVTCRVCQKNIDITGRTEQHVVKCSNCNEATVSSDSAFHQLLIIDMKLKFCVFV